MASSSRGAEKSMAAANIETDMVFPKRRGVEIRISCDSVSHPFTSRIVWWARWNVPAGSVLKKMRAHARMKFSWNFRWW